MITKIELGMDGNRYQLKSTSEGFMLDKLVTKKGNVTFYVYEDGKATPVSFPILKTEAKNLKKFSSVEIDGTALVFKNNETNEKVKIEVKTQLVDSLRSLRETEQAEIYEDVSTKLVEEKRKSQIENGVLIKFDEADLDLLRFGEFWKGLTEIGPGAFKNCTSLRTIDIPSTISKIGLGAFSGCSKLESATIPDALSGYIKTTAVFDDDIRVFSAWGAQLDYKAFDKGVEVVAKEVEDTRKSQIENGVLIRFDEADLNLLRNGEFWKDLTEIGEGAFKNCASLTTIDIPKTITKIGAGAFAGCTQLESATVPDALSNYVETIGVFDEGVQVFAAWGAQLSHEPNKIVAESPAKKPEKILKAKPVEDKRKSKIESDVLVKFDEADIRLFLGLEFWKGITEIGPEAFKDCTSLTTIYIPNTITKIGAGAFSGCTQLESATVPDALTDYIKTTGVFDDGIRVFSEMGFQLDYKPCEKATEVITTDVEEDVDIVEDIDEDALQLEQELYSARGREIQSPILEEEDVSPSLGTVTATPQSPLVAESGSTGLTRRINLSVNEMQQKLGAYYKYFSSTTASFSEEDKITGFNKHYSVSEVEGGRITSGLIMCFINGEKNPTFLKISNLRYNFNKPLPATITDMASLASFVDKNTIYTAEGKIVTSLFLEKLFKLEKVKEDIFDASTATIKEFLPTFDEKFDITDWSETDKKIERKISTQTDVILSVDDPSKPGEKTKQPFVEIRQYEMSSEGEYVSIKLEGSKAVKVVNISDLMEMTGESISPENFTSSYVGKKVKVKVGDRVLVTEPLTIAQISCRYEQSKHIEETREAEDILQPDTWLKMKDGSYIREVDVAKPMCYKFSDSETCHAYAMIVEIGGEEKQIIIDKETYLEAHKRSGYLPTFKFGNVTIDVTKVIAVERTNDFDECDLVQTTSQGKKFEFCKMYRTDASVEMTADEKEAKSADKAIQQANFETEYKKGEFALTSVLVGSELMEVDDVHPRHKYSDTYLAPNYAQRSLAFKAMDKNPIAYESRFGNIGRITGGPKYNYGKANVTIITSSAKAMGYTLAAAISPVGMLAALAVPAILPVMGVSLVAISTIAPLVNTIYGVTYNSINHYKSNKQDKINEKKWQADLTKELTRFYSATKSTENLTQAQFQNECDKIDSLIARLEEAYTSQSFQMVNGKGEINSSNVGIATEFMENAKLENKILLGKSKRGLFGLVESKIIRKLNKKIKALEDKDKLSAKEQRELEQAKAHLEMAKVCQEFVTLRDTKKRTPEQEARFAELQILYSQYSEGFKSKMSSGSIEGYVTEPDEVSVKLKQNAEMAKSFLYIKHVANEDDVIMVNGSEKTIAEIRTILADVEFDFKKGYFVTKTGAKLLWNHKNNSVSLRSDVNIGESYKLNYGDMGIDTVFNGRVSADVIEILNTIVGHVAINLNREEEIAPVAVAEESVEEIEAAEETEEVTEVADEKVAGSKVDAVDGKGDTAEEHKETVKIAAQNTIQETIKKIEQDMEERTGDKKLVLVKGKTNKVLKPFNTKIINYFVKAVETYVKSKKKGKDIDPEIERFILENPNYLIEVVEYLHGIHGKETYPNVRTITDIVSLQNQLCEYVSEAKYIEYAADSSISPTENPFIKGI